MAELVLLHSIFTHIQAGDLGVGSEGGDTGDMYPAHGEGDKPCICSSVTHIATSIPVSQHKVRETIWQHIMQETLRRPKLRPGLRRELTALPQIP